MSVAIVTGASSGIGEALVRELHRRGRKVGLVARREDRLVRLAGELGSNAAVATADVSDEAGLRAAIGRIEQSLGPCDLLVANAGTAIQHPKFGIDVGAVRKVMSVNFDGAVCAAAAVLPGMVARKSGHLAVVSSIASFRGMPRFASYGASKAAVSSFFEALRIELGAVGVAVTLIHPGFVVSEMTTGNKFPQPFMIPTDRAARIIADALDRRASEVVFPWQMALMMGIGRRLPNWAWDLTQRRINRLIPEPANPPASERT